MKHSTDEAISTLRRVEGFLQVLVLSIVFYLVWLKLYRFDSEYQYLGNGKYVMAGVYAALCILVFHYTDCFRYGHLRLSAIIIAQWIGSFIVNFITYFQLSLMANHMLSPWPIIILEVIDVVLDFIFCYLFTYIYHHMHKPRNMVLIYGDLAALAIKLKMDTREDKYHISKMIDASLGIEKILPQLSGYDAVVLSDVGAQERNDILKYCYEHQLRLYVVPKISDIILRGGNEVSLFDTPLFLIRGRGLSFVQRVMKRTGDLLISLIALLILSPVILLVMLLIKLEDGGPVFFTQDRVTEGGRVFRMIKFRSMIVDAEKFGAQPAIDHDPRITRVGRFIRATRLDEIPQLFNILKGDMSIVGPRPERVEHVEKYKKEIPEFVFREKVKGGLTGYAQIFGKYNTTAYDKLRLDLMYIENYSILLDVRLLLLSIQVIVKKESTEGFDKNIDEETLKKLLESSECETADGGRKS